MASSLGSLRVTGMVAPRLYGRCTPGGAARSQCSRRGATRTHARRTLTSHHTEDRELLAQRDKAHAMVAHMQSVLASVANGVEIAEACAGEALERIVNAPFGCRIAEMAHVGRARPVDA